MSPKPYFNMQPGRNGSTNSPGTFRTNQMVRIQGAGERRVVGGSGFIGYLGGGAMKVLAKLTGHTAVKAGSKIYGYEKGGKITNTIKGLFNKSNKN